jgi:uncharacterized membrane protein
MQEVPLMYIMHIDVKVEGVGTATSYMKLLITSFSLASCYFFLLGPNNFFSAFLSIKIDSLT